MLEGKTTDTFIEATEGWEVDEVIQVGLTLEDIPDWVILLMGLFCGIFWIG